MTVKIQATVCNMHEEKILKELQLALVEFIE